MFSVDLRKMRDMVSFAGVLAATTAFKKYLILDTESAMVQKIFIFLKTVSLKYTCQGFDYLGQK
jgi:hypothetical protein